MCTFFASHPHTPTVQFTQLGAMEEGNLAKSFWLQAVGNNPDQYGKDNWVRGRNIHSFPLSHTPSSMSCPAAGIHLNTFHFCSSLMWSKRDGEFKDPTSLFQDWKTSGTWYSKKKAEGPKKPQVYLVAQMLITFILSYKIWKCLVWLLVSPVTSIYVHKIPNLMCFIYFF